MGDSRPITTEHGSDFGQRHAAANVCEIHRDLASLCYIPDAARAAPQRFALDAEYIRYG